MERVNDECINLNLQQKLKDELDNCKSIVCNIEKNSKIKDVLLEYKRKTAYRSQPLSVLGFYKCRLDEGKHCNKYKNSTCHEFIKRFDPKRIRFLLLLRDDIRDFIKRHLINDSFSMYVGERQKLRDALASEHGYNTILNAMSDCLDKPVPKKFNYLKDFLLERAMLMKIISGADNQGYSADVFNIEDEIENLYQVIFETREVYGIQKEFNISKNLQIHFPLYVFKAIMYEYMRNANTHLSQVKKKKPKFNLQAELRNDNYVHIIITNDADSSGYNNIEPFKQELEREGYIHKKEKGLYKNKLLLEAIDNRTKPSITFTQPNNKGIYQFTVNFKIQHNEQSEKKKN